MEIERKVAQGDVDRFANMLRADPAAYWRSEQLQQQHRDAIARTLATTPAGRAAAGSTAPAGPAVAPDRAADQRRHDEIVGMMRDPAQSNAYWKSPQLQGEFREPGSVRQAAGPPAKRAVPRSLAVPQRWRGRLHDEVEIACAGSVRFTRSSASGCCGLR
jgi:hypothetical protein